MTTPKISIVMPVYNAAAFLREAIDSILAQTLTDFEYIIIDDGSTDTSRDIIMSYDDTRIVLLTHKTNKGLVASLNAGLAAAKAPFVARMDADDISLPTRLKEQYDYLQSHSDVVAVGTDATVISTDGRILYEQVTIPTDKAIQRILAVASPFVHGSVMLRKDILLESGGYQSEAYLVEDYDLWVRLSKRGKLANLKQSLYRYRYNPSGETQTKTEQQKAALRKISDSVWQQYPPEGPAPRSLWPTIWPKDLLTREPVADHQRQLAHFHIYFARGYFRHGQWFLGVNHLLAAWKIAPTQFSFYFYYFALPLLPDSLVDILERYLIRFYTKLKGW
jgi:glycosyltransferase involved in cell wall biosynthesis